MTGTYRTICGVISGLMLLCGLYGIEAQANSANKCLTEVLDKTTKAYVMPEHLKFQVTLEEEYELGEIQRNFLMIIEMPSKKIFK